ncbi:protein-glutamate methylesterase/protein-glutamine glutaminase [Jiella pacifica]|uniref:Protein-glutamate methylesterase/protein-glutamine glutaminase n=1 Tax=Jiella pacifica TaxID=2696469 RepID=A0A6N9T2Z5_9HYPH|nr:chemotaxis response regulator protein-glutamate methylesterase [Jiella pacifica]NDW05581.1 chemotaxis-specific protein-glutamate methyltransferase CheB [Jiella pacifica]
MANGRSRAKIRVLIVDDSPSVRTVLGAILAGDPEIAVMGSAPDAYAAAGMIRAEIPDVIFLDIEMPKMDGLTFLKKIMAQRPIPVVICSGLTEEGSDMMMQALAAGAVDVITKPKVHTAQHLRESAMTICDVAKAAAHARVRSRKPRPVTLSVEAKNLAYILIPAISPERAEKLKLATPSTEAVICLGASTGGTEALATVLTTLPADCPATLVVQHMPEGFIEAFARRLDGLCAPRVAEARDGDLALPGQVLIAPGNHHMMLRRAGSRYSVAVVDGPPVCRHRPSVDVLFRSAAQRGGPNVVAAILTGMGDDGARGLLEIRQAGGRTIAQNEETSVVFGMPKEAIDRGGAGQILPLGRIGAELLSLVKPHRTKLS